MRKTKPLKFLKVRHLVLAITSLCLTTSCLDSDEEQTYGLNYGVTDYIYANPTTISLMVAISGNWEIYKTETASWVTLEETSGTGPFIGYIPVSFDRNDTGSTRVFSYKVSGDDGSYVSGSCVQSATRGNGSLGNSPFVSRITGTDGSEILMEYNDDDVPSHIEVNKNGEQLVCYDYTFTEKDSMMYVWEGSTIILAGTYNSARNASGDLISSIDTITWSYDGSTLASSGTIKMGETKEDGSYNSHKVTVGDIESTDTKITHSGYYFTDGDADGNSFEVDLDVTLGDDEDEMTDYISNQNQSVDVNQLMLGVEHMSPHMLLGFYRWMRCGYIYEEASSEDYGTYTLSPSLNSDGSVDTLTVTDPDGDEITYTFEY